MFRERLYGAARDGPEGHPMSAVNDIFVAEGWDRPADFRLRKERLGPDGAAITVAGELDIATAPELRARLDAAINGGARRLVLDLTDVTFMDSVAMAAILNARTRLGDAGRLAVVIPSDSYTRLVFEIAGLPPCLDLYETRDEAIAA
jgi:anti-anti-sigma factor